MNLTLIIGGARSGKSRYAQQLAVASGEPALFVATAEPGDDEMRRRIQAHKRSRPANWQTLEITGNLGPEISRAIGTIPIAIIDCITLLVNNIFNQKAFPNADARALEKQVTEEINGLIECFNKSPAHFIVVTNEVGLGIVPDNEMGRLYRDLLGTANQMLAACADKVFLMVAGVPVPVKPGETA